MLRVQGQSPGVVRVLVATMADLRGQRQVEADEGRALADRMHIPFVECSAKENLNVAEVFTTLIKEIEKDTGFLDDQAQPGTSPSVPILGHLSVPVDGDVSQWACLFQLLPLEVFPRPRKYWLDGSATARSAAEE